MYNNVNVNHPLIQRENNYVSIKKNVSIHSDDRDISKWPNANEFEIELPQPLKQVQYMKLTDINLPNDLCNISSKYQNNKILIGKRESGATDTYSKHTLEIVYTDGCGKNAVVTSVTITGGVVVTIDVDGGSEYNAGDKILISIDNIELGYYTIVSADINGSGVFILGNLTGTMPANPNKIANATYNSTAYYTPILITVPDGAYTPEQLASAIQTIANKDNVPNFKVDATVKGNIFVAYNRPEKKFYAGTSQNKDFVLFFDERSHNYILSQGGYGNCPQNNDQYYTKNMWGLGAILGFEKSNYYAQSVTNDGMFNTTINNYNSVTSEISLSGNYYQNSNAIKHGNIWLPLDNAGPGRELSSPLLPYRFLPPTIYMEVDKYNNSDELVPNANNSSSHNISSKLNNAILSNETCNTSGNIDTLSYKRGMDSSNRTTNIKQRNAFVNQASSITTVKYGGKINSYFAKLSTPEFNNSLYTNIRGEDINSITLFSNQLEERIQKIKVKFRFHDGTFVDFGNSDINFTIEFGTILSDQEKDMKIRNIYGM